MRTGSVCSRRCVGIMVGALLWGAPCWGASLSPLAIPRAPLLLARFARQPAPPPSTTRPLSRRLRAGTVSLGVQGQIGGITGGSELTDHYSFGPGYAIRFRYQLSRGAALGFSFEHQRYETVSGLPPNPDPGAGDSTLIITTVAAEGIAFLHRERETVPYFLGGFGYASPDVVYHGAGTRRVNEGPFLVLGLGFEHFVRERFSIDASARGFGQIGNSELTLATQIALGIHLYPGD